MNSMKMKARVISNITHTPTVIISQENTVTIEFKHIFVQKKFYTKPGHQARFLLS